MDSLALEPTQETPKIVLDKLQDNLEISGISVPEDAQKFYEPILKWIDDYALNPNNKTVFVFKLEYFNTASSKLILDILFKLKTLNEKGNLVLIHWYHEEDDSDMLLAAKTYSEITGLNFEYIVCEFD